MEPEPSVILVGVRGAGKRTLGLIAATALNWRFITEDLYFKKTTGKTRAAYLEAFGNQAFHKENVEVVRRMLLAHRERCVIECGWGSLSSEIHQVLQTLCHSHPVIHITRSIREIQSLLQLDEVQTALFRRANEYHRHCSTHEFYNTPDWKDDQGRGEAPQISLFRTFRLKHAQAQFCSFLDRVRSRGCVPLSSQINRPLAAIPLVERSFTHMVVLRSDHQAPYPELGEIDFIEDAVELKVDSLSRNVVQSTGKKVATLRRYLDVPIVYNVAPNEHRGTFREGEYFTHVQALRHGLRLAVDYLVVDIPSATLDVREMVSGKYSTKILGHCQLPLAQNEPVEAGIAMYKRAASLGCDIARIVYVNATSSGSLDLLDQCLTALRYAISYMARPRPTLITYGEGFPEFEAAKLSNPTLTPVYHPQLSEQESGARGLLTTTDAMKARFQKGQLDPLRIYLIGNVSLRVAPAMFRAALDAAGLASFEYIGQDAIDEQGLHELARDENFGGASITYGFKTVIAPYVDLKSDHATAIGAVNTLLPLRTKFHGDSMVHRLLVDRGRVGPICGWYGDNTDWIGMTVCIQRNLSPRNAIRPKRTTGLVVGGGGMARAAIYAMLRLGLSRVAVSNPWARDANLIPNHFNTWLRSQGWEDQAVLVLHNSQEPWPQDVELPTIIISCPSGAATPETVLPLQWLQRKTGGVVLEMAYTPLITPLLQGVQDLCAQTGQDWVTVNGLEMLTEQGSVQFELLTGRRAPRQTMRVEALKVYGKEELAKHIH